MFQRRKPLMLLGTLLALAVPSLGLAATDDNIVWRSNFTTVRVWNLEANTLYVALNGSIENISSSTDKDYVVVMCQGTRVNKVGISYRAKDGDLDMKAYDLGGNLLGSSATKNDSDSIDISSKNHKAVVLEVYGYNGAVNGYNPSVSCEAPVNPRAQAAAAAAAQR